MNNDNMKTNKHICPAERAGMLDISIRKLLQNPQNILKKDKFHLILQKN